MALSHAGNVAQLTQRYVPGADYVFNAGQAALSSVSSAGQIALDTLGSAGQVALSGAGKVALRAGGGIQGGGIQGAARLLSEHRAYQRNETVEEEV